MVELDFEQPLYEKAQQEIIRESALRIALNGLRYRSRLSSPICRLETYIKKQRDSRILA